MSGVGVVGDFVARRGSLDGGGLISGVRGSGVGVQPLLSSLGCPAPGAQVRSLVAVRHSDVRRDGGAVGEGVSIGIQIGAAWVSGVGVTHGVVMGGNGVVVKVVVMMVSLLLEVPEDVFIRTFVVGVVIEGNVRLSGSDVRWGTQCVGSQDGGVVSEPVEARSS
eukprot:14154484-Heterocapsa_arctica.AAC.1